MDKVLVTLLLVIVSVAALVSVEAWFSENRDNFINKANTKINTTLNTIS